MSYLNLQAKNIAKPQYKTNLSAYFLTYLYIYQNSYSYKKMKDV
jgi:hypothetical protein